MQQTAGSALLRSNSSTSSARILVVDDEPDACEALRLLLESIGHVVVAETSPRRALAKVATQDFGLVLTDVAMSEMSGLDLCRQVTEVRPHLPVVLITGRGTMETAIAALRIGACDFLTKPVDVNSLERAIGHASRPPSNAVGNGRTTAKRARCAPSADLTHVLGRSTAIRQVVELVAQLSGSAASVLLQGETGTGKEVIARAIHDNSLFHAGPFVALNCAALPDGLVETELFGHARGAYTDAKTSSKGLLVQANGGTLLLDEIGELPLAIQPKLLRALQERTVRPVGQHQEVPFDCRLITATNRDLVLEVAERRFREDLLYRLDVVRITVPPLRERGDDILLLAQEFLARFVARSGRELSLSKAVAERLLAHSWPGNVRELENCIERAATLCRSHELELDDLPEKVRSCTPRHQPLAQVAAEPTQVSLFEIERGHIMNTVASLGGNRALAAERLGIDRRTLDRRLLRYESAASPSKKRRWPPD